VTTTDEGAAPAHDGESVLPRPCRDAFDEILDGEPALCDLRIGCHHVGDAHAVERGCGRGDPSFGIGGADEEPPDQHQP
jgi:hypothetical protein